MDDGVPIRKHLGITFRYLNTGFREVLLLPLFSSLFFLLATQPLRADDTNNIQEEIKALQQQNQKLEEKVEKQNQSIESLTEKIQQFETPTNPPSSGLPASTTYTQNAPPYNPASPTPTGYNFGNVNLSAEGGLAFFDTGPQGFAPDGEFRVDEARLFVEAPVWKQVYFQGELDLATRENPGWDVQVGELYLDAQDLSDLWGQDGQLNLRVGQMNIPFGEEYLYRYAIDDPLISHSISDLWGYSPGVELYGAVGKFDYAVAAQNGAYNSTGLNFNNGKSASGRIGFNLNRHWHFSVSAMRTGNLNAQDGSLSAIWFGSGFFQNLGGPETTWYHVDLVEGDIIAKWKSGQVHAFGGYGYYNDNDPAANNGRNFFYYSAEGVQNLPMKFFAALRFSEVMSDKGMPVMGYGSGAYFSALNRELWRLSLGLGYRFSSNFILKTEYSFENGQQLDGEARNDENFFGTEAAFKF